MSTLQTKAGKFKLGLIVGAYTYTSFVMREADLGDMMDAEEEVGPGTLIAFNAALMCRQLVSVSNDEGKEFNGPFTLGMLKNLKPVDYRALRQCQADIDALGEQQPAGTQEPGTPSS